MPTIKVELTPGEWLLVLQSLAHRRMQGGNEKVIFNVANIENKIAEQTRVL